MSSFEKPNIRKKGTLIKKGLLGNLGKGPRGGRALAAGSRCEQLRIGVSFRGFGILAVFE